MIVFTLDALADDSHRRHLIDLTDKIHVQKAFFQEDVTWKQYKEQWQPDYPAYYDWCDSDMPILSTLKMFNLILYHWESQVDVVIFGNDCESVRKKVCTWLSKNLIGESPSFYCDTLKLRPIGDHRPQEELFEEWCNDSCIETKWGHKDNIDMVFSSHGPTIDMFRTRGVFVFDCNQGK